MLSNADKKWIKDLPNTAFFGWAGFKHELMSHLGIDANSFTTWNVPADWMEVFKREVKRRRI